MRHMGGACVVIANPARATNESATSVVVRSGLLPLGRDTAFPPRGPVLNNTIVEASSG